MDFTYEIFKISVTSWTTVWQFSRAQTKFVSCWAAILGNVSQVGQVNFLWTNRFLYFSLTWSTVKCDNSTPSVIVIVSWFDWQEKNILIYVWSLIYDIVCLQSPPCWTSSIFFNSGILICYFCYDLFIVFVYVLLCWMGSFYRSL
jgi:hypothetical protein